MVYHADFFAWYAQRRYLDLGRFVPEVFDNCVMERDRLGFHVLLSLLCCCAGGAQAQAPETTDDVVPAEFRWAQRKDRILLTIELQVLAVYGWNASVDACTDARCAWTGRACMMRSLR